MKLSGLAFLPFVAMAALAQDAAQPAAPPTPVVVEPPKPPESVGLDALRRPDGKVVHFYRVNYVSAAVLKEELDRWLPKDSVIVQSAAYPAAPTSRERETRVPAVPPPRDVTAPNVLRIEIA